MKEVKENRVAGPFNKIPFDNYIQSPVGLVPKTGGKTRMIFHLSYNFTHKRKGRDMKQDPEEGKSLNECTPNSLCTVKYNDLDSAVTQCLELLQHFKSNKKSTERTNGNEDGNSGDADDTNDEPIVFLGKTDLSSTFRVLPLKVGCFCWLVFKAVDPSDGKMKYFIDKCLPFGVSLSCSHYQRFSNALKHILLYRAGQKNCRKRGATNYLDDFLFLALTRLLCNNLMNQFLTLCQELHILVTLEKPEWADTIIVFLGILLDGKNRTLSILWKSNKRLWHCSMI